MADSVMKNPSAIPSDLKSFISSSSRTRGTRLFAYGFVFSFIACTAFLAFNPSTNESSPGFYNLLSSSSASTFKASMAPYRSQVSSLFSHFFPNSSSSVTNQTNGGAGSSKGAILGTGSGLNGAMGKNQTDQLGFGSKERGKDSGKNGVLGKNHTVSVTVSKGSEIKNQTATNGSPLKGNGASIAKGGILGKNQVKDGILGVKNQTLSSATRSKGSGVSTEKKKGAEIKNQTATSLTSSAAKSNSSSKSQSNANGRKKEKWIENMIGCDLFHGHWIKDESYPLYPEGSCPHIDEPFDCYLNGRPDRSYQKFRWQPSGCNIPR